MSIEINRWVGMRQTGASCVLASYGVAIRYFGGPDTNEVFEAYCAMHSVSASNLGDRETIATCLFTRNSASSSGYGVLCDAHRSEFPVFARANQLCTITPYAYSTFEEMASFLVAEEAIALVCLNPSIDGTGLHSVAVAANSDGLIYRNDTNIGAPDRIEAVSDLWAPYPGLGSIGDVLVLKRRLTMMIDAQTAVAGSAAPRGAI